MPGHTGQENRRQASTRGTSTRWPNVPVEELGLGIGHHRRLQELDIGRREGKRRDVAESVLEAGKDRVRALERIPACVQGGEVQQCHRRRVAIDWRNRIGAAGSGPKQSLHHTAPFAQAALDQT